MYITTCSSYVCVSMIKYASVSSRRFRFPYHRKSHVARAQFIRSIESRQCFYSARSLALKTRSLGSKAAASVCSGGGRIEGAGMSRTKHTLPEGGGTGGGGGGGTGGVRVW